MAFQIKKRAWDASNELNPILSGITLPKETKADFEVELWNDLCSEYDSLHFYHRAKLYERGYSAEFRRFLESWRADEENHAQGFLKLYQASFGGARASILARLDTRISNFEALSGYFEDEFRLCLLIAYDEMVTTVAYHLDRLFYREIGGKALEDWIAKIKADEATHFSNLLLVIKERHLHRVAEGRAAIEEILKLDLKQTDYRGTFVLDHTGAPFTPELLSDCAYRIIKKLEALK